MSEHQRLAPAFFAVLSAIGLAMVVDVLLAALPLRPDDVSWRFQVEGQVLSAAPQSALLLLVLVAVGVYSGRFRAIKAGAWLCFALSLILTVLLPLFALDFLTVRRLQPQSRLPAFHRSGVKLAAIGALLAPTLLWMGLRSLGAGRKDPATQTTEGPGLLIGQAPRVATESAKPR